MWIEPEHSRILDARWEVENRFDNAVEIVLIDQIEVSEPSL